MRDKQLLGILKALADPTRLLLIKHMAEQTLLSCSHARSHSSLSQPAISHHFCKLSEAGIVFERKKGVKKYYELNTELLETFGIDVKKMVVQEIANQ